MTIIPDILAELRAHVARKYRKQWLAAEAWGVCKSTVSLALRGKGPITKVMLDDAGIEIVYRFKEEETNSRASV